MALGTDADIVKIGKASTQAAIENSIAIQCQRSIGVDAEA